MRIRKKFKFSDINWGSLPELPARLNNLGFNETTTENITAEINRSSQQIEYDSFNDAVEDVKKNGNPQKYDIRVYRHFSNRPMIFIRIDSDGDEIALVVDGIDKPETFDSIMHFLGFKAEDLKKEDLESDNLEAEELSPLPSIPKRTAFIAHRFDDKGKSSAIKLGRFLELIGFKVITGEDYAPDYVSSKVLQRIEKQAVIFVILTPGTDDTWLIQESTIGKIKEKPLIILKEKKAKFKPGILADHEYIPFELPNIEGGFIKVLEGLKDLGYLEFN